MPNNENILDLMVAHHALIEALLEVCQANFQKNKEIAGKSLAKLRWELEKHIFIEEKVIFNCSCSYELDINEIISRLIEEHIAMIDMLANIDKQLVSNTEANFTGFHRLLAEHRNVEEKTLYPKIDNALDREIKEEIIARVNEIPLKN